MDLIVYAFEEKMLDRFMPDANKKELLDALLWSTKSRGCSIAVEEIHKIMKLEGFY